MLSIPSAQQRRRAHICFVFPALEEHRIKYFLPSFSLPTLHYNFRPPFTQLHNITREPQNTSHSLTKVWEISTAIPYICTAHLYRVKDEEHRRTKRASRTFVSFFVIHSIILDLLLPPTPQYLVSPQIYEMNIESKKCARAWHSAEIIARAICTSQ